MDTRSKTLIARAERKAKSPEVLHNRLPAYVAKSQKTLLVILKNKISEVVEFKVIKKLGNM